VFVLCLLVFQSLSGALELDRQQVLSGEIWRIWTGHFVHTNGLHLTLNIVAALVIYFGFFTRIKLGELLACGFVFTALISLALLWILPDLDWYNGLSGLLHAFVAYFCIRLARDGAMVYWVGLGIVWLKVLVETTRTNLVYENLIGDMHVITDAHLIGAFVGTVAAIIGVVFWRGTAQPEHG
jgi:rhomboid family GlyGly-CTERM serine protease